MRRSLVASVESTLRISGLAVFRMRIGSNSDPVFTAIWIRIQWVKPIWIWILFRLFRHKKLNFYMKNILYVGNMSQNIPTLVQKPFWKAGSKIYLLTLGNFIAPGTGSAFPIRIRIPESNISADLDTVSAWAMDIDIVTTKKQKGLFGFSLITNNVPVVHYGAVRNGLRGEIHYKGHFFRGGGA